MALMQSPPSESQDQPCGDPPWPASKYSRLGRSVPQDVANVLGGDRANHGPVVSGRTLDAAICATEKLEQTAQLFLLLRNTPVRQLNDAQIDELNSIFKK